MKYPRIDNMDFLKQLTKRFFQYEAELVLKKYKPKIIAISGSVGKSSTRTAVYQTLSKKFFVRKNEKSFTSELGIPLTIIGCSQGSGGLSHWIQNILAGLRLLLYKNQYPEYLILEIDCDKPGDLAGLSLWLSPDILILTAMGETPTHIESFGTLENFQNEQKKIIDSVQRDGCIVYNADDNTTSHLVTSAEVKTISVGLSGDVTFQGDMFDIIYEAVNGRIVPVGMSFSIIPSTDKIMIRGSLGIHNEYAYLLAYAVATELGLTHKEIVSQLKNYKPLPGRMNIIFGIKDSIVIDDSYNSSPIAVKQALHVLDQVNPTLQKKKSTTKPKKILVFGDMFELGKYSTDEHRKIAHDIEGVATHVITVGIRSRTTAEELLSLGFKEDNLAQVDTSSEAGRLLQNMVGQNDVVLVKGSQAMRMEKIVEEIMLYPEVRRKLLVRQEPEWLERE